MAQTIQHVLEFSPDGKLFAFINEQGILKIWDTETNILKQEYTPNLHLSAPCTCFTWVIVSHSLSKNKGKTSKKSLDGNSLLENFYLALGTSKGIVTMYSYSLGKVDHNLEGEGHSSKINHITYDNANLLYTCGDDYKIIVWNVSVGKRVASWNVENEKPQSAIWLPISEKILIGARQLQLYAPHTQEFIKTFTGHTSEVTLFSCFAYNSVEYALSASRMERIICLWTLNSKSKKKNASCTFIMEDIAHCISCDIDEEGNFRIAAVTRSGVIHIYVDSIENLKPEKPVKPKVTIEISSDSATVIEPIPAVAVSFKHSAKNKEILFAYGDKHFLQFEHLSPNIAEKHQVLIREHPKSLSLKKFHKQNENTLKTITPVVKADDVQYTSGTTISRKKMKPVQMPMETRLQNLYLGKGETPQTHSKVQLLVQALQSKDSNLLMSVLAINDPKVIQLTLQKLPIQYIGSLVNELSLLMQKKRTNVQIASNWLRTLVKIHSSQLMALGADDLLTKFGPCLGIIEHRVNCLKEISKLNGRLNLLVNQVRQNTEESILNNENILVYEDEDSSNSDLEIDNIKTSSEDEWQENDSEEEMDVVKDV